MNAEILCVGTELLLGDILNTNAQHIAKELALCGINCYYQGVVGDNPDRLKESLTLSLGRSDMVILTGGLGPTYDDLTKEVVAEYFGRPLVFHQQSYDHLVEVFSKFNTAMTENNKKQAYMPEGAVVFPNSCGTANGLAVEGKGKLAVLMPGPPREMTEMFESQVLPFLKKRSSTTFFSRNIHLFGVGESSVEQTLRELMVNSVNPTIAPYAKTNEVLLRVTASAANEAEAVKLIDPVVEEIKRFYPENVYGVDVKTLQNALVAELTERRLKIATAESCTGGMVSRRITDIDGASAVFDCGICSYANSIKEKVLGVSAETLVRHGAVSPETALEMAKGVKKLADADIGLSTTGIAGPGGGSKEKPVGLVYVAVSSDWAEEAVELRLSRGYRNERDSIRYAASSNALFLALKTVRKQG